MRDEAMIVVEPIAKGHNGLPRALVPGDVVWLFRDTTYGCCGPTEVPISLLGSYAHPFHGVPHRSVKLRGRDTTEVTK